jgi:hypothetical protein
MAQRGDCVVVPHHAAVSGGDGTQDAQRTHTHSNNRHHTHTTAAA